MASVWEKLKKVIAEQLGVDEASIEPSSSFVDDLNIDPSDLAELITAIEQEFSTLKQKLEISNEDMDGIVTIQDLVDCLHDYGIGD